MAGEGESLATDATPPSRDEVLAIGARICAAASLAAVADAQLLELVGEFDHHGGADIDNGWGGTAGWLAYRCGMTGNVAREHVRVARALRRMPTVMALLRAGRVSYSKVRAATRVVDVVDEARLARLMVALSAAELEKTVARFRSVAGTRVRQQRERVCSWSSDHTGLVALRAVLPPEEGALVTAALEAAYVRLPPGDRTAVEALLEVCRGYLGSGPDDASGADRMMVVVTVAAESLVAAAAGELPEPPDEGGPAVIPPTGNPLTPELPEPGEPPVLSGIQWPEASVLRGAATGTDGPDTDVSAETPRASATLREAAAVLTDSTCHISGIGPLEAQTALRLTCSSPVVGVIINRDGDVLHHGRERRFVSRKQRRALTVRDRGICQYPGCERTRNLDAHHIIAWAAGGPTDLDNLILLCGFHHTCVHEGGMRIVERPGTGCRRTFLLPDGKPVSTDDHSFDDRSLTCALDWHHRHVTGVTDLRSPEANRLFPKTAGVPFSLIGAVDALFSMQTAIAA